MKSSGTTVVRRVVLATNMVLSAPVFGGHCLFRLVYQDGRIIRFAGPGRRRRPRSRFTAGGETDDYMTDVHEIG